MLDGRIKASAQTAIKHQRADHVAGYIGLAEPPCDRRPPPPPPPAARASGRAAVRSRWAYQHQVADGEAAIAADRQPCTGRKERLGDEELAVLLDHRDAR